MSIQKYKIIRTNQNTLYFDNISMVALHLLNNYSLNTTYVNGNAIVDLITTKDLRDAISELHNNGTLSLVRYNKKTNENSHSIVKAI